MNSPASDWKFCFNPEKIKTLTMLFSPQHMYNKMTQKDNKISFAWIKPNAKDLR